MGKRNHKKDLQEDSLFLTETEVRILNDQIRKNSKFIDKLVITIDLLANQERCPKDANTLSILRRKLSIAVEENDTFRKVLWRHAQLVESQEILFPRIDPITFLVNQIRTKRRALIAQAAMK